MLSVCHNIIKLLALVPQDIKEIHAWNVHYHLVKINPFWNVITMKIVLMTELVGMKNVLTLAV